MVIYSPQAIARIVGKKTGCGNRTQYGNDGEVYEANPREPEVGAGRARCPALGRTSTDAAKRQMKKRCEPHINSGRNSMSTGSAHQTVIFCLGKPKLAVEKTCQYRLCRR